MNEITSISKKRLEHTLESLNAELEELSVRVAEARELGDLSENEEYTASLAEYIEKMRKKSEIENTLKTSSVKQNYSTNISNGSLISVKLINNDGTEEDMGLLLFDEEGSSVFSGVVSPDSSLGRAIQGGVGGEYIVQNIRGNDVKYVVNLEPESRIDEYLEKYPPDRQKTLDRMFEGIK